MRARGLLAAALFGLAVPNGLFIYWLTHEFRGVGEVLSNHLAMAFVVDAAVTMAVLAYAIAVLGQRTGRITVRWPVFVAMSLVGGLSFSVPFAWWLSERRARSS